MSVQRGFINIIIVIFFAATVVIGSYYFIENRNKISDQTIPNLKLRPNSKVGWVAAASRPALEPIETPDGILLITEKEGDESTIFLDIKVPEMTNIFSFDIKFQEKGDGDWLTATLNDQLLFSFDGGSYFGKDFENMLLPIGYFAGNTGVLKFTLHGFGSATSSVFIKNVKFLFVNEP